MQMFDKKISVILPAYNEEENIEICVRVAHSILSCVVRDFEIIIVNDGSTDKTGSICNELEIALSKIRVISKSKNEGYGYALRDGFKSARYDLVSFSDSDRQFDMYDIKNLLPFIDQYDLVVGYRKDRQDPFARKVFSLCYNMLVRSIFALRVRDINCAFKLFRKSIFDKIKIESGTLRGQYRDTGKGRRAWLFRKRNGSLAFSAVRRVI